MTKAQINAANRIQAKFAAGWRFAVDWPPGFQSQIGRIEKRGGHMSEKRNAWHGDTISQMGVQRP